MANLTNYQKDINNATWIDINPDYPNSQFIPERLADLQSVSICSIPVLLSCAIGDRGGIFEPTYGSNLYYFLQEPIDETTSYKLRMSIITTIQTWEPRIEIDLSKTTVIPDLTLPGYRLTLTLIYKETGESDTQQFNLYAGS